MGGKIEGKTQKGNITQKKWMIGNINSLSKVDRIKKIKKQTTEKVRDQQTCKKDLSQNRNKIPTVSAVQSETDRLKLISEHEDKTFKGVTLSQLEEISKYRNPPNRVKMVLEAVTLLLTSKKSGWDQIRTIFTGHDCIEKILKYDHEQTKPHIIEIIKKEYLLHPDWNIEKIKKASKATGPLAEWVEMQIGINKGG